MEFFEPKVTPCSIVELRRSIGKKGDAKSDASVRVDFKINPESITDTLKANINKVQLINSTLPRSIINGTTGREVSFKALLYGMSNEVLNPVQSPNQGDKFSLKDFGINAFSNIASKSAVYLVPFASNIIQGLQSLDNLIGSNLFGQSEFTINKNFNGDTVDYKIDQLMHLLVSPKNNKTSARQVTITGYPFFESKVFYVTEVTANRKFFDPKLNTQVAEVTISLIQAGSLTDSGFSADRL